MTAAGQQLDRRCVGGWDCRRAEVRKTQGVREEGRTSPPSNNSWESETTEKSTEVRGQASTKVGGRKNKKSHATAQTMEGSARRRGRTEASEMR